MPAGIDAPLRLRRSVRVYRAVRFGLSYKRRVSYSENFRYRTWHLGFWCVHVFTTVESD